MARYAARQTAVQIEAADFLSDAERRFDRGVFFGSIARTCNHVLRDDALWLARFTGDERLEARLPTPCFAPGGGERTISRPRWVCAVHLFNHQSHHRGQIHAMLTAAGAKPAPTDVMVLPDLP